ncbi:MAG: hypothetical protein HOV83_08565, partial [Catenulispora sp.]|nr:hypothetical protein [Catenulispora sp.]
ALSAAAERAVADRMAAAARELARRAPWAARDAQASPSQAASPWPSPAPSPSLPWQRSLAATTVLHPPSGIIFEGEVSEDDRRRISKAISDGVRQALENAAAGSRHQPPAAEVSEPVDPGRADLERGRYQVPSYQDEGRPTNVELLETLAPEQAPGVAVFSEPSPVQGALIAHMPGNRYLNLRSPRYVSAGTLTEALVVADRLFAVGSYGVVQGPIDGERMRYLAVATEPAASDQDLGERSDPFVPAELQGVPAELAGLGVVRRAGEEILSTLRGTDGEYLIRGLVTTDRRPHWRNASMASLWYDQLAREQQHGITEPEPEAARVILFDDIDALLEQIDAGDDSKLQQAAELLSTFDAEAFALVGWETKVRYLKVLLAAWTWQEQERAVVEIFKSLQSTSELTAVLALLKQSGHYDQLFDDLDSRLYDLLATVGHRFARDRGAFTLRQLLDLAESMGLLPDVLRTAAAAASGAPGASALLPDGTSPRLLDEAHEAAAGLLRFGSDAVEALILLFTETGKFFDGLAALADLLAQMAMAGEGYPPAVERLRVLLTQLESSVLDGVRGADALGVSEKVKNRIRWRLMWEVASFLVGIGEIKAAVAGAEIGTKLAGVLRFLAALLRLGEAVEEEADAARLARLAALFKAERAAVASAEEAAELLSHLPDDDIRRLGRLLNTHDLHENETLAQLATRNAELHKTVKDAFAKAEVLRTLAAKGTGLSEETLRVFATLVQTEGMNTAFAARVAAAIPEGEIARFAATLERIPLHRLPPSSRVLILELAAGSTRRMDAVTRFGYDAFLAVSRRAAGGAEDTERLLETLEQIEQRFAGEGKEADFRRFLDRLERGEQDAARELDDAHRARLGTAAKPPPVDWPVLEARIEYGPPRRRTGGFLSRPVRDGDREVVFVEGRVREQLSQAETMAGHTPTLPGEHATHAIAMQLGENLPEAIVSGPAATYNLGPLKRVENVTREVYEQAIRHGADVETSALVRVEYRVVDGDEVPVVVGVRRTAWVVPPGTGEPLPPFVDFEAVVDPVTREVTETWHTLQRPGESIGSVGKDGL